MKISIAEGLPQTEVAAQSIENASADNGKGSAIYVGTDEEWKELTELIISFTDGFSTELQKIINQKKRHRKMVITFSLLVCAGILTGYAVRKIISSKRKKMTLNRRRVTNCPIPQNTQQ